LLPLHPLIVLQEVSNHTLVLYVFRSFCGQQDDEDDDEIESEDADSDVDQSTGSTSVVGGPSSGKMTARQAVLANVVGSSHVSLSMLLNFLHI
jgi:hypothetical protein